MATVRRTGNSRHTIQTEPIVGQYVVQSASITILRIAKYTAQSRANEKV